MFSCVSLVFRLFSARIPLIFRFYFSYALPRFSTLLQHPSGGSFARLVLLPGSPATRNQIECAEYSHRLP